MSDKTYDSIEEALDEIDRLNDRLDTALNELEEARLASPEWGNCKRGCAPAYLDENGFCSPACAMGAPKGEFVTYAPQ